MPAKPKPRKQPNPKNPERELEFYKACSLKTASRAKQLLAEGADPIHGVPTFMAPLVAAASAGTLEIVEALLTAGAPIDEYGAQALVGAAGRTDAAGIAIFDRLVALGALTARSGAWTRGAPPDYTPLAIALCDFEAAFAMHDSANATRSELERVEAVVKRLVDAGADPSVASDGAVPVQQLAKLMSAGRDRLHAREMAGRLVALLSR